MVQYKLIASLVEMLLHADVNFHLTNKVEVLIVVSLLNTMAHNQFYSSMHSGSRVCVGVHDGVYCIV
jgi:hypothetical protein